MSSHSDKTHSDESASAAAEYEGKIAVQTKAPSPAASPAASSPRDGGAEEKPSKTAVNVLTGEGSSLGATELSGEDFDPENHFYPVS